MDSHSRSDSEGSYASDIPFLEPQTLAVEEAMIEPSLTYLEAFRFGEIQDEGHVCIARHPQEHLVDNVIFRGRFPILPFHVIAALLSDESVVIYKVAKQDSELREDEEFIRQGAIRVESGPDEWLDQPRQTCQPWKTLQEKGNVVTMHFFPQDTNDGTLAFANQTDSQELMTATEQDGIKFWDYSTGLCLFVIGGSASCTVANPLGSNLLLSFHETGNVRLTDLQSKKSKVNGTTCHYSVWQFCSDAALKNVFLRIDPNGFLTYHVDSNHSFELVHHLDRPTPKGHFPTIELVQFIPGDPCQVVTVTDMAWLSLFNVVYCTYPSDRVSHLVPHRHIKVDGALAPRQTTMFRRGNGFHLAIPGFSELLFFLHRIGEDGIGELVQTDLKVPNTRSCRTVNIHPSGHIVVLNQSCNVVFIRRYGASIPPPK